jgi:indole-3-glycerol phosphate synthase
LHIAKELDIQCLVECHNKHEINDAISAGAEIIGINNRDLTTFSVDLDRFSELRKLIPANIAVVSESGMNTFHDASKMKAYGADAILIGTSLMKSDNIPEKIKELRGLRK